MKTYIRYNNNRNVIFVIQCYSNYNKVITYRKTVNNCLKINSVKYFPIGVYINFNGNNPFIDTPKDITSYSQQLWNARNVYNKWKQLVHNGNEWTLYQKDILNN